MLHCVDLSCGPPGSLPLQPVLMQLKVTALASAQLCVRDLRWGRIWGLGLKLNSWSMYPLNPFCSFQKELTLRLRDPETAKELSPERFAATMESGKVGISNHLSPKSIYKCLL